MTSGELSFRIGSRSAHIQTSSASDVQASRDVMRSYVARKYSDTHTAKPLVSLDQSDDVSRVLILAKDGHLKTK